MSAKSPLINVMVAAALKAGRNLARDFGEVEQLQVTPKGPGDFVSAADKRAEETLIYELKRARPKYSFLCEESGEIEGANPDVRWIIDPLDGTTNFLHGIPQFCISIGLQKEDFLLAGVIYDVIKNEIFWAEKGAGAYMNDRRLRVSGRRKLPECIIGTGMPFKGHGEEAGPYLKKLENIMPEVAGVRRMGSAALDLAYVAAGRFDGFFESHLKLWDTAAGLIMVQEAGGTITDYAGKPYALDGQDVLVSNSKIHKNLVDLVG